VPVSHVDIYPTLSELSGVTAPSSLQGQSLVGLLKDPQAPSRGWALSQVQRGAKVRQPRAEGEAASAEPFFGYSLRTPRWRYTEWDEGREGRELYDHDSDPNELRNLAADPNHAATIEQLHQQLAAAVAQTLPADGQMPSVKPGPWHPVLVQP
jgi:iduronate 2-sulfatase